jgi:glycerol-3-phosphate dehydrogenase
MLAEEAVDLVVRKLGCVGPACRTASVPLPGASAETTNQLVAGLLEKHGGWLDEPAARHLALAHGTGGHAVAALGDDDSTLRERVSLELPVLRAEIVHAVRTEMALTLTDVVVRRTPLGTAGHPGPTVAQTCAKILGTELQWSTGRVSDEMESLRRFYDPISYEALPPAAE